MPRIRSFQLAYTGLWLIRIYFALCGTGYIHPDEHLQNGEITAGDILGLHTLSTWEWHPDMPIRSVLPVFATTGLPLLVLKLLFAAPTIHPSLIFRTQRLVFLFLSGVLDYSVSSLISSPTSRRLGLLLLASSFVTSTFQVRPFSNSLESAVLALCLVVLRSMADERTRLKVGKKNVDNEGSRSNALKHDLHLLAALAVIGIFTRPTFIAFILPIACQALRFSYEAAGSPVRVSGLLLRPLCTAMLVSFVFIAIDTYYFRGDFSKLVITPYNFIRYNLSTENLADHGIHPIWLHVGVNLPMLLGPLLIWLAWCNFCEYVKPNECRFQRVHFEADILKQTLVQIVILSLSILSLRPHQEPRFLMPLILPIIVLAVTAELPRPRKLGKLFWASWIVFNMVLAVVFGLLHQGGLVPSLLFLHSTLKNANAGTSTHVIYWKTYMPPWHILGVSRQDVVLGKMTSADLSGASEDKLMAALYASSSNVTLLVTPVPMYLTLPQGVRPRIALKKRIFPHLDLDHLPESIQSGGYDGLSLGVYAVEWKHDADGLAVDET